MLKDLTVSKKAGLVLLIAGLIQVFGMQLAEYVFPGYSISQNYISDLGANNITSALLFNVTLFILGIGVICASIWLLKINVDKIFCGLLIFAGIGCVIVSIFNLKTIGSVHYLGAFMAFVLSAFAAIRARYTVLRGNRLGDITMVLGS